MKKDNIFVISDKNEYVTVVRKFFEVNLDLSYAQNKCSRGAYQVFQGYMGNITSPQMHKTITLGHVTVCRKKLTAALFLRELLEESE